MKRLLVVSLTLLLLIPQIQATYAVEDGTSAAGSSFVVPVVIGSKSSCTGVMISKNVVATAAHCILDESKQIAKSIYVGPPGSNLVGGRKANVTHTFIPDDYLGISVDNKVEDSDIAYLVLDELYSTYGAIEIASENDLISLRSKRAPLRVIGYGSTTNSGDSNFLPHYFDGVFESNYNTTLLNSFGVTSTKGNACVGDSGSPILSITPKKVMLVGILTGSPHNEGGECTKKSLSNTYSAVFSGVGRYSNVMHLALVQGLENLNDVSRNSDLNYETLAAEKRDLDSLNVDLQLQIEELKGQLIELTAEVNLLRNMKKVISCVSGTKTKTVTGTKPKCPSGYRQK